MDIETPFEEVVTEDNVLEVMRERGLDIPGGDSEETEVGETPTEPEPPEPDETETDDVEEPVDEPVVVEAPAPAQVDAWDIGGERLSRDELERLVGFQRLLESNPTVLQAVTQAIDQALTPAPQQVALPEGFDPDDPIVQWTQHQMLAMQARLDAAETAAHQVQESQEMQQRAAAQGLIGRAKKSFAQQNQLEPGTVEALYERAAQTINIPGLLQSPIDPRDGKPWKPDALTVLEAALDMTYSATPEGRQREFALLAEAQKKSEERKAKLSALGGQKGTVPQAPVLPEDPRLAAIAIATEAMTGSMPE